MSVKQINPYLNFSGSGAAAITFYESALEAKTENRMSFGDAKMPGHETTPENKDRVMHATLKIGAGSIMLSDGPPGMPIPSDSNTHVCLDFDDPADLEKKFHALAAGGTVTMPVQDTFWGAKFGMLTDKFNIRWMFNCELKKA
jgi:PhnB protein